MKLYTIYDLTAEQSGPIFEAKNDKIALRQFNNLFAESQINKEEFTLNYLGEYNHDLMELSSCIPVSINIISLGEKNE